MNEWLNKVGQDSKLLRAKESCKSHDHLHPEVT